ncbi:MAG: Omp28-related outer membrane protein [Melioribacteraceae bacterium]|nr:MAG: Omp28-related outer membrane protein [Melioribacteraceae bacterium]
MKKLLIIFITFAAFSLLKAQDFDRNILIEVFTNSHCPLCPPAHSAIDSYLSTGSGKDRVNYIYYHMIFPYSDDQLNKDNPADAAARNNFYGPFGGTPVGFFDGTTQSGGYSSWGSKIDARLAVKSPLQINLSGSKAVDGNFTVNAELNVGSNITGNNVIHFIVVEDVNYIGRNGVNPHKHVMRKMVTPSAGENIELSSNQTISKTVTLNSAWNTNNLGILVFVQNSSTKEVYQSEFVTYNELGTTGVEENNSIPLSYNLFQNYPNPFNPSTAIEYEIPKEEHVVLKVYNLLGREIAELVNSNKSAGKYKINFNAKNLASGVYYYSIQAGEFIQSRKFILLK